MLVSFDGQRGMIRQQKRLQQFHVKLVKFNVKGMFRSSLVPKNLTYKWRIGGKLAYEVTDCSYFVWEVIFTSWNGAAKANFSISVSSLQVRTDLLRSWASPGFFFFKSTFLQRLRCFFDE